MYMTIHNVDFCVSCKNKINHYLLSMKILHNIIFFSSLTASTQNSSFFAKWCLRRRFFFLFLSKNFEPLLWFHSSPGDHNFNKLESFLHYNVSIQAPAFLAQRFRRRKIIIFLILCKTSNPIIAPPYTRGS